MMMILNRFLTLGGSLSVAIALLGLAQFGAPPAGASEANDAKLRVFIDGPQRSPKNIARDRYRHPFAVLTFFGVRDSATIVEIDPGGAGYWTEILAPYLKDRGRYIAANGPKDSPSEEVRRGNAAFAAKIAADSADYSKVEIAEFDPGRKDPSPPGQADFVLTFRNIHNWMADGAAEAAFQAFYKALKPGGVLGVEEHRGRPDQPQDPKAKSGYVRQDYAIHLAEAAGFKLAGESEVNANPKDTKDYPAGVWTLPPTFRLKDQDRAKYEAIGESDRFVLKFVKP
ncbi:MAG TPA: methyltransferase [Roseiarcus sp.]|nr:methyltransferase [Roseiarcus sp.]